MVLMVSLLIRVLEDKTLVETASTRTSRGFWWDSALLQGEAHAGCGVENPVRASDLPATTDPYSF